ncbi:MAG: cell division protein ZapA [Paludibacteraceae bacterium]|nr:cell division protein ZapA [Paludibacteraceae bacterium]
MEKDAINPKLQHLRGSIEDALTINLHILGQTMNLTIERREEELYRKAERLINLRYNMYASLYAESRDNNRFAAMTLLDIALMAQKAEYIQSDVVSKLLELGNKITSDIAE